MLCGCIGNPAPTCRCGGHGSYIDDGTATIIFHNRNHKFHDLECGSQVGGKHLVPFGVGNLVHIRQAAAYAGIIYQDIYLSIVIQCSLHQCVKRFCGGNVCFLEKCVSAGFFDYGYNLAACFLCCACDNYLGDFLSHQNGGSSSNTFC